LRTRQVTVERRCESLSAASLALKNIAWGVANHFRPRSAHHTAGSKKLEPAHLPPSLYAVVTVELVPNPRGFEFWNEVVSRQRALKNVFVYDFPSCIPGQPHNSHTSPSWRRASNEAANYGCHLF
jgi:hypothetical protein